MHEGDDVVVVGAGPIGCLHVRLARARGAKRVFLVELSRERLDLPRPRSPRMPRSAARETDAVAAVLEATGGRGADVVITAAPSGARRSKR